MRHGLEQLEPDLELLFLRRQRSGLFGETGLGGFARRILGRGLIAGRRDACREVGERVQRIPQQSGDLGIQTLDLLAELRHPIDSAIQPLPGLVRRGAGGGAAVCSGDGDVFQTKRLPELRRQSGHIGLLLARRSSGRPGVVDLIPSCREILGRPTLSLAGPAATHALIARRLQP